MEEQKEKQRFERILAAIGLSVLSCVLFVLGVGNIAGAQVLTRGKITKAVRATDLLSEYGQVTTQVINTCFYHMTGLPAESGLYVTEDDLPELLDEAQIRSFVTDKCVEYANVLTRGSSAQIEAEELLPFTESMRTRMQQLAGVEVTDAQMINEINTALTLNEMYAKAGQKMIRVGWGVVMIVAASLLQLLMMYIRRGNLLIAALYSCAVLIVCAAVFFLLGPILLQSKWAQVLMDSMQGTTQLLDNWILLAHRTIRGEGVAFLVSLIAPVGLMIAYWIDASNLRKWSAGVS